MTSSEELRKAWEFIEHTNVSVFLTGKAGTGKTTFLRYVKENSKKSLIVVAPTGVAAINAGGVTIHSFFQLPPQPYIPGLNYREKYNFSKKKLKIIRSLDMLVIDEISMVRSDLLDAIDNALRKYRKSTEVFGGVQLLMIGDLQQLTPVTTAADEEVLAQHYSTPYFFGSNALAHKEYVTIELTKIYRQKDSEFVELLNDVRHNRVSAKDIALLKSRYKPMFEPSVDEGYVRLTTHNHIAEAYNRKRMEALKTVSKKYKAYIKGEFSDTIYPTAGELELKCGAQVMFVKNDSARHTYYNGKIGVIKELGEEYVKVQGVEDKYPIVVERALWENNKYTVDPTTHSIETECVGTFQQFPLRSAWAITIHKSQGLTFNRAIVDAGRSFAPGQVYVALSRCRTLEGLVLTTPLTNSSILSDETVNDYMAKQQVVAKKNIGMLEAYKEDYHRELLKKLFTFYSMAQSAERMERYLRQHGGNSLRTEASTWEDALDKMKVEISDVAFKWLSKIDNAPFSDIVGEEGRQRIKQSCVYFQKKLKDIFEPCLRRIGDIKNGNKDFMARVGENIEDFKTGYGLHVAMLGVFSQKEFAVERYIEIKQHELLNIREKGKRGNGRSKIEKKEKKEDTRAVTLRLWKEGKNVAQIAIERSLTENTIRGHLLTSIPITYNLLGRMFGAENVATVATALSRGRDLTRADVYETYLKGKIEKDKYYKICQALNKIEL